MTIFHDFFLSYRHIKVYSHYRLCYVTGVFIEGKLTHTVYVYPGGFGVSGCSDGVYH